MKKIIFNKKFFKFSTFVLALFLVFGSYSNKAEAYAWQNGYWTTGNVTSSQIVCVGPTPDAVNLAWNNVPGALSYTIARNNGSPFAMFNNSVFFGTYTDWNPVPNIQNTYQIQAFAGLNGSGSVIDFVDHTSDVANCPSITVGTSSGGPFGEGPLTLLTGQSLYIFLDQTQIFTGAQGNMFNCTFSIPSGTPSGVISSGSVASGFTPTPIDSSHPFYPSTSGSTYLLSCTRSTGTVVSDSVVVSGASASTPPSPPVISSATPGLCGTRSISVAWGTTTGATLYEINDGNPFPPANIANIVYSGTSTSFVHGLLTAGSSHSYYARVTTASGTSSWSPAPTNATAPANCGYTVTPSAGPNGSISPNTPQTVSSGGTTNFTVTPNASYTASVGGTCGGSLVGTNYTTNPINADCTVIASFALGAAPDLTASAPTPTSAILNSATTFNSVISNVGSASSGAAFTNIFQFDDDANHASVAGIRLPTAGPVAASANVPVSTSYTFATTGTWYVRVCADNNASFVGGIAESDEGNNCSGWTTVTVGLGSGGPYTVTANAGANGTISPSSQSVASGNTTTFSVSPNSGYTATMSTTCAGGVGSPASGSSAFTYTTLGINSNCSVTATFAATSATGFVTANSCTIPLNASSCNTTVIWGTTNPIGIPQVTSNKNNSGVASPGFVIGNGNSGGPVTAAIYGGTPFGTRSFFLYHNSGSLLDSVNPTANCIAGSTWNTTSSSCLANAPDLTAAAPTTNSATPGTPVTLSSPGVSNIGTATTGVGFNNLWQVNTAANGGGTTSVVSVNAMAALPPASTYTATSSYTFTSAGTYSVRLCADMNSSMVGTIAESNEGNNCSSWTNVAVGTPSSPDLVVPAINDPSLTPGFSVTAGQSSIFFSGMQNIGTATTGVSAFNNLFQYDDDANHATVYANQIQSGGPVAAGAPTYGLSDSFAVPVSFSSLYVRFCADNNASFVGVVTESDENNNCSNWVLFPVTPSGGSGPDLTAGSASPTTATGSVGQTYTASISNIGTTTTGAPFSYFWQRASAAAGGGTIISLAFSNMSALTTGSSATATSPSISFGVGTRSVRVCADFTGPGVGAAITETNEANNCGPWTDITVNAVQPAPTVTLTATPLNVAPPATTTSSLSWSTTNLADPDYCTSNFFAGNRLISNSATPGSPIVVTPVAPSSTYTIQCFRLSDSQASAPSSQTVNVGSSGPKKPIFIEN